MGFLMKILFYFILSSFFTILSAQSSNFKTVAFAQDTMSNDFRKAQVYEVRDELAKYPDLKFIYSDAEGQTSLLIRQIEKFIAMRVDLIILGTNNEEAVVPVISKAYKNGIPVIVLDRGIKGENYTTFINSDNIKIGAIGAEYIAQELHGKGEVLLFEGLQKADVTKLRTKGFMDEISKYKDIKVIKRTGNYLRKDSIIEMEKLIKEKIHIDAIFSQSDSMLSGARSAMQRYKMDPSSIITVGCDYTGEAKEAIKKGTQSGSILFPLGGTKAVEVALKIFAKEDVPKYISIPVKLITKNNVEDVKPIF
jgi:ribose transport system substrate-binding protein